ncbi:MAG: PTS sugar transporter subunit IIA [Gammaproteobacteria bacterium]|nr:PTS sugar transporter subunit IIA [Sideroxydans sp.]MBU3902924.1 PTS sugar transporter subunit IIA [Gammaproteobacteria bacterium]MBU4046768.1 PTS sugar transporter subunit IIA [Gammaproteobacteria bacterium]MBU4150991.1 PTS sugar transporter subunit IIA [Gammaproteobacteria bacterium]
MAGILVVAHNALGESLVDCVQHVLGKVPENVRVLSMYADDDPEQKLAEGHALIQQLDKGNGVLILADIFGATPSNVARQLCRKEHIMGVAGVNLPMLLRVVCHPNKDMPELARIALEGGRECIVTMGDE